MSDTNAVIDTLNNLIETCKDGEYGFRSCAEHAKSSPLKALLESRAEACQVAASSLQTHVVELGGSPETGGSVTGSVHRGWVAVRSALSSYDDLAVLKECERGEDAAKKAYQEALGKDLPAPVRALIEQQYQGVQRNHDQIRDMRDALNASN